ncbi:MAG: Asp-tRNA(Asn)/Glu-tRNA(Gln) amidotransferase subunit GatB [Rhodospirillaceae bacterium TMED63]|nr:Asp-tRNA(Asn)/Glu-tRNA(Gln) amidotransferase GatCAB subunit B [Rhodospirillaceae bacterium]RPF95963.1 MAG: Asp-tRNA(Asn)/Glu-tRNA(Gln) amidotransferase subunit GatB [Rhodospirillaceae bacterium TMED63]
MTLIQGRTGDWEIVIGLEVHAQVTSKSKLFSGASSEFGAEPNTQVSLVDAAMPGMLPVINANAVEQAVRTGLGLNAQINLKSIFDRKNYFYPDLPQGYQISQYLDPVVGKGEIEIDLEDGSTRTIGITRLHLEQDAGKSIHDQDPRKTLVDLNRSGVALMEIVSEPDIRSAEEAGAYVEKIRSILRYLGTCDGNMQEGSMRADVNVSVRKPGDDFGTRAEIKNVNSIRFIRQAIDYEVRRQIQLIEDGGEVDQETRLFDPDRGETRSMRSKEEAHDYRYFPDPDLLPLEFEQSWVDAIRETLPELPDQKKRRFVNDYGVSVIDAGTLVAEREIAEFFEAVAEGRDAKVAANWVMGELFGALNRTDTDIATSPVSAAQLGQLVDLIADGTVSNRLAKNVFEIMFETSDDPKKIVEQRGMKQVTDAGAIEAAVDEAIAAGAAQVDQYKSGNEKVLGWFVGQVMKATHGKANPQAVNEMLRKKLDG